MTNVDTSSYPKAQPGKSLLDQVGQYQQLESQKLSVEKQKLDQINQGYEYLLREMNSLNPDTATIDDVRRVGQNAVKMKLIKPDAYATFITGFPQDNIKKGLAETIGKLLNTQEAINFQYGPQPSLVNQGAALEPMQPMQRDRAVRPAGAPIPLQVPPTAPEVDPGTGQPRLRGVAPSFNPDGGIRTPGMAQPRPALPVAPGGPGNMLPEGNVPIQPGPSANFGGNVLGAVAEAPTFNDRFGAAMPAMRPATAPPPMFDEGKKQLVADQQEGSQRAMRIKPLAQAIDLMQKPGMLSGPLSEQFTQTVAALKTFGLIPQEANDPTAIRQEVAKKLAQYVSGNPIGQRSDNAQVLAEASSPNPKAQTLEALFKLSKDAIALDRVQIVMPNAFKDKDLSKYGSFKSLFPQSIDERAFALDFEKDRGAKLVQDMQKKLQKNAKDKEALKFFKSLEIADQAGFY